MDTDSEAVLKFWFEENGPQEWWCGDRLFDEVLRGRYAGLLRQASQAELSNWRATARGRLAEIIVLDQFSRHIHRGTPMAFAQDAMALGMV